MITGILIYCATLAFLPAYLGYFSFFFVNNKKILNDFKIDKNLSIIIIIVLLSFINKLIGYKHISNFVDIIPENILMILMIWVAKSLNKNSIKIIIYFALVELIFVIFEHFLKISSVLPNLKITFDSGSLLYDSRPYGLSSNTSVIALKFFLSLILIIRYKLFSKKITILFIFFISLGILVTFNRTVVISAILFCFLLLIKFYKNNIYSKISVLGLAITFILLINNYFKYIYLQLTRGYKGIDMLSGRGEIWLKFINFIKENLLLGNNSYKYFVEHAGKAHAHSSYLEILATHGLLISSLLLFFVFRNINYKNSYYIIPILFYSLTQYGIFWGFSITDIVLYTIIFNIKIDHETLSQKTEISTN